MEPTPPSFPLRICRVVSVTTQAAIESASCNRFLFKALRQPQTSLSRHPEFCHFRGQSAGAATVSKSVVKRTFQQWYEFSVTSSLLGQQFPHPLLRRSVIQYFHRAVGMCDAGTAMVTGQAALGGVVNLHAQLAQQHVARFHPVNIAVGDLDDDHC